MAITLGDMKTGGAPKAPRIVVYGPPGIGKTWLGADAPNPVFLQTESGLGERETDTPHFPLVKDVLSVNEILDALLGEHDRQTLVIDTADWLDHMIADAVYASHSPQELGYGKDQVIISEWWRKLLDKMNALRERGMATLFLAHSQIKSMNAPDSAGYDRYVPKLSKAGTAALQEWADAVLFAHQPVAIIQEEGGFNRKRTRGIGAETVLCTRPNAAYIAKNRYNLPEQIPFGAGQPNAWDVINAGVAGKFRRDAGNEPI